MNNDKNTRKGETAFGSKVRRILILFVVEIVLVILIFIVIQVFKAA